MNQKSSDLAEAAVNEETNKSEELRHEKAEHLVDEVGDSVEQTPKKTELAKLTEELLQLKDLTASLQEHLKIEKDNALRAQAELQNIKRRAEKDVEKAHRFGLEKFVMSLLPVVDSLERGLESVVASPENEGNTQSIREGIELTLKLFLDVLEKSNIVPIDPTGQMFNPEHHQAMTHQENPDVEPGSVITVFQKGYTLNGRLIRPAMVVVAKAPK